MHVLKYAVAVLAVGLIGHGDTRAGEPIAESQECKALAMSLPSPGSAIKRGLPHYPGAALSQRNTPSGYVLMSFQLGGDGQPRDIKVLCEIPNGLGFAASAEKALTETIYPSGKAGEYGRVTRYRMQ